MAGDHGHQRRHESAPAGPTTGATASTAGNRPSRRAPQRRARAVSPCRARVNRRHGRRSSRLPWSRPLRAAVLSVTGSALRRGSGSTRENSHVLTGMDIIVVDTHWSGTAPYAARFRHRHRGVRARWMPTQDDNCYSLRTVPTVEISVTTPSPRRPGWPWTASAPRAVLRAGLGLLDPATRLLPGAQVGFIGLARDEEPRPVSCLCSLPKDLTGRHVVVLDPMLATGGSLVSTLETLTGRAPPASRWCVLCAPEGIELVRDSGLAKPSSPRRSTIASTRTPSSFPAWVTPATASSAPAARRPATRRRPPRPPPRPAS